MNVMVSIGIWVLCGCAMSYLVYIVDENKSDRQEIYHTNLYIIFMIILWPMSVYFFLRFFVAAVSRKPGGGND